MAGAAVAVLAGEARGAGLVAGVPLEGAAAPAIREDLLLLLDDGSGQRLFHAARVEPAAETVKVLVPAPAEAMAPRALAFDLPQAMHELVAGLSRRGARPVPVAPAPWSTRGATASATWLDVAGRDALSAPLRAWSEALGPRWPRLAALEVRAPAGRVEVLTPTLEVRWPGRTEGIVWREPEPTGPAAAAEAPRPTGWEPLRVEDIERSVEAAPSAETFAKIIRGRRDAARACHAAFVEARPGQGVAVRTRIIVNRRGDTITAVEVPLPAGAADDAGSAGVADAGALRRGVADAGSARRGEADAGAAGAAAADPARDALAKCITKVLRETQLPRIDEEYELRVTIAFDAPPVPPRRTRVLLLGRDRLRWASPPSHVQLVREGEPTAQEVSAALPPPVREGLDLGPGARWWVSEYLDTSDRRTGAADLRVAREPLPTPEPAKPAAEPARTTKPRARALASPRVAARVSMALVAAAAVALALWLGRDRAARPGAR